MLEGALTRDDSGRFVLRDTSDLRAFLRDNKPWMLVTTSIGETASRDRVFPFASNSAQHIRPIDDVIPEYAEDHRAIALVETLNTSWGKIRVIYGAPASLIHPYLARLVMGGDLYAAQLGGVLLAIFLAACLQDGITRAGTRTLEKRVAQLDRPDLLLLLSSKHIPKDLLPIAGMIDQLIRHTRQRHEAHDRYLIDAAHELRTPIAIMQARIEGLPPSAENLRLHDDVVRLKEVAEQLLDFEFGKRTSHDRTILDLVTLVREAVADLAPIAIAHGYEISFSHGEEQVFRRVQPIPLRRAVNNLIRNAIDHGGGRGQISVTVTDRGAILVEDEGPGIPQHQQELVFEPFYRVAPRSTGAGLGLSLVKQVVESHQGEIRVESHQGGTCFIITLPEGVLDHTEKVEQAENGNQPHGLAKRSEERR